MLVFRVVLMVAALVGILYSIYKVNTGGVSKELFHMEQPASAFQESQVQKFEWRTQNKISSLEKDPSGKWIPFERETKVREILNTLSTLSLAPLEQKGAAQITVVLQIQGGTWTGAWDGMTFLWTEGPKKGTGTVLNDSQNKLFFKGKFVFEPDLVLNLCQTRVAHFKVTLDSKEYDIHQVKRGWEVTGVVQKALDPIFIEKWLIQSCQVTPNTVMDPAYTPRVGERVNRLVLNYVDGSKLDFFNLENDLVMMNDRAVLLNGYKTLFEDLKNHILPASNPQKGP